MNDVFIGKTKLVDLTPFVTNDYVKAGGQQIEKIEGRYKVAYVRCPKCRKFNSIYRDEINYKGYTKFKRCTCGFNKQYLLKKWRNK